MGNPAGFAQGVANGITGIGKDISGWWKHVSTPPGTANMDALNSQMQTQNAQALAMNKMLLSAPQTIAPDNFLSTKASQLATLRRGLLSTMTNGAGGVPSPVLSTPTLMPTGANQKTGT